jgi:hypothetical protein
VKVLLLRANNIRHRALGAILEKEGFLSAEVIESKPTFATSGSSLIELHLESRDQSEKDFFGFSSNYSPSKSFIHVNSGEINSCEVHDFVKHSEFDIAISFGVSILKPELIERLKNSVMGIHLGLSPYYRGSGTNFFPFVNSDLGAVGYTLMHLNAEIDKGPIIHQGRARIVLGDSIHTIGNRNISSMFDSIIELLKIRVNPSSAISISNHKGKLYKRKDFTEDALIQAYKNLDSGLIRNYLSSKDKLLTQLPIVENLELRAFSE